MKNICARALVWTAVFSSLGWAWNCQADDQEAFDKLDTCAKELAALASNESALANRTAPANRPAPAPGGGFSAAPKPAARPAHSREEVSASLQRSVWFGMIDSGYWLVAFNKKSSLWIYASGDESIDLNGHFEVGEDSTVVLTFGNNSAAYRFDEGQLTAQSPGAWPKTVTNSMPDALRLTAAGKSFREYYRKQNE